jgi:predicted PurR-regulated permease PerM
MRFFVSVIGLVVVFAVLKELQGIFMPFVIAYFIYFLFAPLNNALYDRKVPIAVLIIFDIIIISFIVAGISSILYGSVVAFSQDIEKYTTKLNEMVRSASKAIGIRDSYFRSFSIQRIIARLDYKEVAGNVFTSAFGVTGGIVLVMFFFIFIVSGHHAVYIAFKRRFQPHSDPSLFDGHPVEPARQNVNIESTVKEIIKQIQKYIVSKIALNLSAAILVGLTLTILGVDFPVIWGIFTFFLNFIPSIGSALSLVLPSVMALLVSNSIGYAVLTASLIAAIQTVVFNFLEPHLLGKRLDLNPIVILLSVLLWGYVWGIVGMLLAVPLTAIIKIILGNSQNKNARFIVDLMDEG